MILCIEYISYVSVRSNRMQTNSVVLPPSVISSSTTIYATQGGIYALDAKSGNLQQNYYVQGSARPTLVNDILYISISSLSGDMIQAFNTDDNAPLWSYKTEGRLSSLPTVMGEMVYTSTVEGDVFALDATNGSLIWRYKTDPILFASPAIMDEIVYISPAVNPPSKPSVQALHAKDGTLLWQAQIPDSTSFPLVTVDAAIYVSTYSGCSALHRSNGSSIWHYEIKGSVRSLPVVTKGAVYFSLSEWRDDVYSFKYGKIKQWQEAGICALRASDGSLLWQQHLGADTEANNPTVPVVTHDAIYIGANDGIINALHIDDGTPLWRFKTNGTLLSSPTIMDGVIYIGVNDGSVYALQASNGVLLWKTFVGISESLTMGYLQS
jgi:eukaryotic-like serine/threonine-protein kinase